MEQAFQSDGQPFNQMKRTERSTLGHLTCIFCKISFIEASYCVRHLIVAHGRVPLTHKEAQILDFCLDRFYKRSDNRQTMSNTNAMDSPSTNAGTFNTSFMDSVTNYNDMSMEKKSELLDSIFKNQKKPGEGVMSKNSMPGYEFGMSNMFLAQIGLQVIEKPFQCTMCSYSCNRKCHLQRHIRIHTGEKPYKCDVCGFAYNDRGSLTAHKRKHTGEKPFKCNICEYSSTQKGSVDRHMKRHTGEKPFSCGFCAYACSRKENLITHKRTHTNERPFKCDLCTFSCKIKCNLKSHQRKHTGEKPYKCGSCSYATTQKGSLMRHLRIHSGDKPYKCETCGYRSTQKSSLTTHKKKNACEKFKKRKPTGAVLIM